MEIIFTVDSDTCFKDSVVADRVMRLARIRGGVLVRVHIVRLGTTLVIALALDLSLTMISNRFLNRLSAFTPAPNRTRGITIYAYS